MEYFQEFGLMVDRQRISRFFGDMHLFNPTRLSRVN